MGDAIEITVNGVPHRVQADPGSMLLSVLRDDLGLTGTKYGCGEGQCGACTVLIEGEPVRSCITRLDTAAGKRITTVEGLAHGGRLAPIQEAFLAAGAMQCGYCTAGMLMAGAGLLAKTVDPGEREIREALEGNICRCGTYPRIVTAVRMASQIAKESPHA